jgi:hypothetical protein
VKDHQQGDAVKPYHGALLQMGEASMELPWDIHILEKGMQYHGPGKRCKSLIFEAKLRELVDSAVNLCFTEFHL